MKVDVQIAAALPIVLSGILCQPVAVQAGEGSSFYAQWKAKVAGRVLYGRMLSTFRNARSLSFESEYVRQTNVGELGRATYSVWMKKPNLARIESRSSDGAHAGMIVLDGRELWIYWPTGRPPISGPDTTVYAATSTPSYMKEKAVWGTLSLTREMRLLGTGVSTTILELSIFHGSADPAEDRFDGAKRIGTERVGDEMCDVVEASFVGGQRSRTFWISKRDHLPRRIEEVVRVKRDVVTRESWSNVVVGGDMASDLFAWQPPEGCAEFALPSLEDGLLKPGTEAPDFAAVLADGGSFRLSEHRGKLVWLFFWRIACPPCREEMPYLNELHRKYAASGLLIIGFNFADERSSAEKFMRERSARFPSIIDNSAAAQEVYFRKYQTVKGLSAVPLSYIIGRDGKVIDAWYGFQKGDDRGLKIIREQGVAP